MPAFTPNQYAKRDRLLLELAALHRILLPRCAAHLLAGGKPLTHALNRLTDAGLLLRFERSLPGGLSYYSLSAQGCARIGAARDRAELSSGSALDVAIAVHYYVAFSPRPCFRITCEEAEELVGAAVPANVPWILSAELGEPKVFRVMLAANRPPAAAVRHLRTLLDQAMQHAALGAWVSAKQLGFAALAPTKASAAAMERAVEKSKLRQRAAILVGVGPDAEHLSDALKIQGGKP